MSYQLPSAFLQKFSPKEIHELKRVFKEHDNDYAAAIDVSDLHTVLLKMGENVTPSQTDTILKQVSLERKSHVTFQEFLTLFYDLRNGAIAIDAAALVGQVSISSPAPVAPTAPVTASSSFAPSAAPANVEKVPFFKKKSAWEPDSDEEDELDAPAAQAPQAPQAPQPSPFAQKAQWPPAGTAAATAPSPPPAPTKPQWPPANGGSNGAAAAAPSASSVGKQWPPVKTTTTTTPPKETATKPQWPPTGSTAATTSTSPNAKPQWPPTQPAAPPSPSKKPWPPTHATVGPPSPSSKPSWPPQQSAAPSSPSKPAWPPQQSAAPSSPSKPAWPPQTAALSSPSKPQWPPTQPAATSASPTKPQWPPTAPSPARQEPSPSQKPAWPPTNTQPSPTTNANGEPKRAQWPPAASSSVAAPSHAQPEPVLDTHARELLQRRASAAAMYNANVTIHEVKGPTSSVHSYSEEETAAFTEHINNCLQHDKDLASVVPIKAKDGLFRSVTDGILLCKLVNAAVPETIDGRAINKKKSKQLNVYEMTENQNLCINAAKSIGCSVVNIGPTDLIEGRPILVLGLVWQIIKIQLTSTINLKSHPELVRLLQEGESLEAFMKLPPDQILLRWMNYHLKAAGHAKQVTNFSHDVQDAVAYSVLLHQIAPQSCDLCHEAVAEERAAHVIQNARKLNIETFIKPRDITSGNPKLNMSFVAQLFNTCPALDIVEEEMKQLEEILYDDVGDTREERVFRMWINSLGIDEVYINHLFSDLRDGINLLKVFEKIEKGIVAWQKVNLIAPNKFKQVENCNYCVVLGKQLKFSLVNIGGADIFEGNKKLILSVIWQSMRHQQLRLLSELAAKTHGRVSGEGITDNDIIQWANGKVAQGGKPGTRPIVAFRDLSLADSVYLLSLIHAVEPRAVNWELVTAGETDEDKASNAKYAISCAQKIGATVFLTYEDIVEVKPKMMMTFVASLMSVDMNRH